MSMRFFVHLVAPWALLINLGCPATNVTLEPETPPDQLTIEKLEFTRKASSTDEWAIQAERASGDLGTTELENVTFRLHRLGQVSPVLRGSAPKGRLDIRKGQLEFESLTLNDPQGAHIAMPYAILAGQPSHLKATGPVTYERAGLRLKAAEAEFTQETGVLSLSGPVEGTIYRSPLPEP